MDGMAGGVRTVNGNLRNGNGNKPIKRDRATNP
jgi:hypothetical protein